MSLASCPVVFDASVLINLLASQRAEDIIRSLGVPACICPAVLEETMYVRSEVAGEPPRQVRIDQFLEAGVLEEVDLNDDKERELYIEYSMGLDDGEAMTIALAENRCLAVATDDKKARRFAQRDGSSVASVISTPMLIRHWADVKRPSVEALRLAINRIEHLARFRPDTADPLRQWWDSQR